MRITDFKTRLQELLNYYNLKRTEFMDRTGLDKSTVSLYLSGKREPGQNRISLIADAYNVNPAWLMGYDVPMQRVENPTLDRLSNPNEMQLEIVDKLNTLPPDMQERVLDYVDLLVMSMNQGKE